MSSVENTLVAVVGEGAEEERGRRWWSRGEGGALTQQIAARGAVLSLLSEGCFFAALGIHDLVVPP